MAARNSDAIETTSTLMKSVERLSAQDLQKLAARIHELRMRQNGNSLSRDESGLLRQINKGFSAAWWRRLDALNEKRRSETLTSTQHRQLIRLTDQLERRQAERLQALAKLAELRHSTIDNLMSDLGLLTEKQ